MIRDCRIADHIKAEKDMTSPEVMSFFVYVKTIQQPPHRAGDCDDTTVPDSWQDNMVAIRKL